MAWVCFVWKASPSMQEEIIFWYFVDSRESAIYLHKQVANAEVTRYRKVEMSDLHSPEMDGYSMSLALRQNMIHMHVTPWSIDHPKLMQGSLENSEVCRNHPKPFTRCVCVYVFGLNSRVGKSLPRPVAAATSYSACHVAQNRQGSDVEICLDNSLQWSQAMDIRHSINILYII